MLKIKPIKSFLENISSSFFNIFTSFSQKKSIYKSNPLIFQERFDSLKNNEIKIKEEKRRRHQAYIALDYLYPLRSYFDFFTKDTFYIATNSKNFTQILGKKIITSDILLLPFFYTDSPISEILQKYGITKENTENIILEYNPGEMYSKFNLNFLKDFIKNLIIYSPIEIQKIKPNLSIKFSLEVNTIFEKAAENALKRFKTPVISTEILFITLMEQDKTRAARILKKFIPDEMNWLLLRYNLLKKLYTHESTIRTQVTVNQQYFAYLLKIKFSDLEFENTIKNGYLSDVVSSFRNELIGEALKINIHSLLKTEIYKSLKNLKSTKNKIQKD